MNIKTKHTLINIGTSKEYTIKKYANMITKLLNTNLKVNFNNNKNFDGVYSKILDTNLAKKYGWKPKISFFKKAILETYNDLAKIIKSLEIISEIRSTKQRKIVFIYISNPNIIWILSLLYRWLRI